MQGKDSNHGPKIHSVEDRLKRLERAHSMRTAEHNSVIKGDDSDGKLNWTAKSFMAYILLCCVFTGSSHLIPATRSLNIEKSQMPLYFSAGGLSYIVADIGGVSTSSWLPVSYTLAAAISIPLCGHLQDIFGRRPLALAAIATTVVGAIVMGTAHTFGQGVTTMAVCEAGAGVAELSALAG
jgi:MFS family permease